LAALDGVTAKIKNPTAQAQPEAFGVGWLVFSVATGALAVRAHPFQV